VGEAAGGRGCGGRASARPTRTSGSRGLRSNACRSSASPSANAAAPDASRPASVASMPAGRGGTWPINPTARLCSALTCAGSRASARRSSTSAAFAPSSPRPLPREPLSVRGSSCVVLRNVTRCCCAAIRKGGAQGKAHSTGAVRQNRSGRWASLERAPEFRSSQRRHPLCLLIPPKLLPARSERLHRKDHTRPLENKAALQRLRCRSRALSQRQGRGGWSRPKATGHAPAAAATRPPRAEPPRCRE
jgi:hypothetical protein